MAVNPPKSFGELDAQQRRWDLWSGEYDQIHEFHGIEATVDFLEKYVGPSGQALELGVGTGRIAIPMAQRGILVRGVEVSPAMASKLAAKDGGSLVGVIIGDMAKVPSDPHCSLIYCVFSTLFSLLSQERQVECFESAAEALEEGGRFVVECMVPTRGNLLKERQQVVVRNLDDQSAFITVSRNWPDRQIVRFQDISVKNGRVDMLPVEMRYSWPSEIDLMARLAGLTLESRSADWCGEEFGPDSSMHVSVYRKIGNR